MVYGLFYLPLELQHSLLAEKYHFDDSKVLTAKFRASLFETLYTPSSDLYAKCGWAVRLMSARDISTGMLRRTAPYNLNAQAMDATIDLIKLVLSQGVNVTQIYIDTIGKPESYQRKLAKIFPTVQITVAKKADSLYPCVSAASVCAKVTRDLALEAAYSRFYAKAPSPGWGSGYPSDARCSAWLKDNMHPLFGWGLECRFSWGTAKDLLGTKNNKLKIDWPSEGEPINDMRISSFFKESSDNDLNQEGDGDMRSWFGQQVTCTAF